MFKNYLYVSGTTQTLKDHFGDLAEDALARVSSIGTRVIDIACNDGTLLEQFREKSGGSADIYGVDPAKNLRAITKKKDIPVLVDYWGPKVVGKMPFADIITATNVFAHVDDVYEFLNTCKLMMTNKGITIIEVPYALNLLKNLEFDTIYHEHLSYFLVSSMVRLTDRALLNIIDIEETPIHGGSIRFYLSSQMLESPKVMEYVEREREAGYLSPEGYQDFAQKVDKIRGDLTSYANGLRNEGKAFMGYGASAKGNTLLNYTKLKLDYIVDDNPMKWDYLTPGMDIPIVPPEYIAEETLGIDILVLSWNFYKEIAKKVQDLRGPGRTNLVRYIPEIKVTNV